MENTKPLISAVFTHWAMNEARSLIARASLESLLTSGREWPLEVVVVDNGGSVEDSAWFLALAEKQRIACYVRNPLNVSFGRARNQGLLLTHGEHVLILDNDILFPVEGAWIPALLEPFQAFPEEKIITSPFRYTDEREKYKGEMLGKWETNLRAGSNCFLAKRKTFMEVGLFKHHRIAGSMFTDAIVRLGYRTAIVPETGISDHGLRKGYGHNLPFEVLVPLTNGKNMRLLTP